jgi:hypothetical protein
MRSQGAIREYHHQTVLRRNETAQKVIYTSKILTSLQICGEKTIHLEFYTSPKESRCPNHLACGVRMG